MANDFYCPKCGAMFYNPGSRCSTCGYLLRAGGREEETAFRPFKLGSRPVAAKGEADKPKTIEELSEWYSKLGLPPQETTRFFIGRNVQEPRAFGIYKRPDGTVEVYKNKNDGTRAIRYQGPDERYGVNELRLRLIQEINNQIANGKNVSDTLTNSSVRERLSENSEPSSFYSGWNHWYSRSETNPVKKEWGAIILVLWLLIMFLSSVFGGDSGSSHSRGSNSHYTDYDWDYDSGSGYDSGSDSGWDSGGTDFDSDWHH